MLAVEHICSFIPMRRYLFSRMNTTPRENPLRIDAHSAHP